MRGETQLETTLPDTTADDSRQEPMTCRRAEFDGRVVTAVLHSPFLPVGYVLVDGHLLLPATWQDNAPPPAIGDRVTVEVPYGRPAADALPIHAHPLSAAQQQPPAGQQPPAEQHPLAGQQPPAEQRPLAMSTADLAPPDLPTMYLRRANLPTADLAPPPDQGEPDLPQEHQLDGPQGAN
jgi:hypothetical protein